MRIIPIAAAAILAAGTASANVSVPCGGSFSSFTAKMTDAAVRKGHDRAAAQRFFASARHDPATIKADRAQGIFQKTFTEFSRQLISQNRMDHGRRNLQRHKAIFDRMERQYGVSRGGVLTAFWAFETDYGGYQGDFNTLNSLMTLSHDCRRPELFQPQVFAALELYERGGDFDPATSKGAWAGEIGMVQMLPGDIIEAGVDGDGDGGVVDLRRSPADALLSGGANMLKRLGWRAGEPWLQEVVVPDNLDWSKTGLDTTMSVSQWAKLGVKARAGSLGGSGNLKASILLPQGGARARPSSPIRTTGSISNGTRALSM